MNGFSKIGMGELALIGGTRDNMERKEVIRRIRARGQKDPVWWMENIAGWKLWEKQKEVAQAIVDYERVAVPASFSVGKSWLAARLLLWFVYCFYPSRVISTSSTLSQVRNILWAEVRIAHAQSKFPLGGHLQILRLDVSEDQFAIGFSPRDYDIDSFTGYHAQNQLVIFDQASGVSSTNWTGAEGLMTSENCKWLAISNTAEADSEMAEICTGSKKWGKWEIIPILAHDSPNVKTGKDTIPGLVTKKWVDARLEAWGENDPLTRIFLYAEFVEASTMTVVRAQDRKAMFKREGTMGTDLVISLDVARQGLDSSLWFIRSGTRMLYCAAVTGNDLMVLSGKTIELRRWAEKRWGMKCSAIVIDIIGLGAGVYDRLAEVNESVVPFNAAEGSSDTERFLNLRAEGAWNLRALAEETDFGFALCEWETPDLRDTVDGDIKAQLYKISSNGKIQIVDKEEIRRTLGRSPDGYDSLVMVVYTSIGSLAVLDLSPKTKVLKVTKKEMDILEGRRLPEEDDWIEWGS